MTTCSGKRDEKADRLLAGLLAGMPRKTTFDTAVEPSPDVPEQVRIIPLPKSIGFAYVDANRIELMTGLTGGDPRRGKFELDDVADDLSTAWVFGEPEPGTVVLLRSSSLSELREAGSSINQVYVFAQGGRKLGPFPAEYFRNRRRHRISRCRRSRKRSLRVTTRCECRTMGSRSSE